jgi:TolB-like protein
MPPEAENNLRLEIGHVLFIDLVGYSKLLIEEQKEQLRHLTEIVLATPQVVEATNEKLVRLPTGDGTALVFRNSSEEPVRCALEIAQALKERPDIAVRMGIHSGPVSEVTDVSGRTNIAGAGINTAQRVMDCGDAGHILLSKRLAEDLGNYGRWQPYLHDLGDVEVKHGVRIGIVNFVGDQLGNPALPEKIAARRHEQTTASEIEEKRSRRKRRLLAVTFLAVTIAAIVVSIIAYRISRQLSQEQLVRKAASLIPEKSVAVFPFENLTRDPENAFLSTGIQDEILTRLAKIAALKVISRTSTKQYDSRPGNLSDIAKQLGVATILEGSVQKVGPKVRVNVQLIKATTDAHLWAETYDRELIDVLAVESEVATEIASALRAALSPEEKARIDEKPTNNAEAYALYLRGKEVLDQAADVRGEIERAAGLYEQAIAIDPKFALAHAQLATITASLFLVFEPREAFKIEARAAAEESLPAKT